MERKSEQFKNIFMEKNQELRVFMMNNQINKEQEKSVLISPKFLDEELEFLKEEHISIQDTDSKWSWLTSELAEKYFISVLLPYYIINPNLTYEQLYQLGFNAFIHALKRQMQGIYFSDIKNKYLNLDTQKQIEFLNKKFGIDTANKKLENAKSKLEDIIDTFSKVIIKRNILKIKLFLDLGFPQIKCKECDIGVNLLVAIESHHPTESREFEIRNLYNNPKDYKLIIEKFKKDKIELLCSNHHLEKRLFYPIIFKDIIFKADLFSMSAEEIDAYIDEYLSAFVKTERYKKIILEKYISKNKEVPLYFRWKQNIQRWIKKRFVFNELFDGKCLICGDSNLSHLGLHHIDPNLKVFIKNWHLISNLDCIEIIRRIIREKCVCLCANCHVLITRKYHISVPKILKGYLPQQEIDKISEEVMLKYNDAIEKISNFKYDLENIDLECPLKLEFSHDNMWKIHLMTVYYYLEIKERSFFFNNEFLYDLELTPRFINVFIKELIEMGYVQKFGSLLKYSLTEKGKDKNLNLIQEFKKKRSR